MTHSSPANETTEGYTEGYAASLRQQADLMEKANAGKVSAYVAIDDFDVDELRDAADFIESISAQQMPTPAAKWREEGKPDPHLTRYDCEREHLPHGDMTDDEIANAVFLNNHDIDVLTAAKDRIRWLSRQLTEAKRLLSMSALTSPERNIP